MRREHSPRRRTQASSHLLRARPRGAAAVEFAAVLPLLITILLGATDFGRFAHTLIAVTNAARAGASFAGTHPYTATSRPAWESGIRDAVRADLEQISEFDASQLVVKATPATDSEGRGRVAVEVTYPFQSIVTWPFLPSSFTLKQTAVFPRTR